VWYHREDVLPQRRCGTGTPDKMFCLREGVVPVPQRRCFASEKVWYHREDVLPQRRCGTTETFCLREGVVPKRRCFASEKVWYHREDVLPQRRCGTGTTEKMFCLS
jgi:hypothetical protein